jgi:hypothetical protein
MSIGSSPLLYNSPLDPAWSATHQTDHFSLADGATKATGALVPTLPLDPIPLPPRGSPELMLAWFQRHQAIHAALSAALGINLMDLSYVDFTSQTEEGQTAIADWIYYNGQFHNEAASAIARITLEKAEIEAQQEQQSQPVNPQGLDQIEEQPTGNQAITPQGNPGIQTIQPQTAGTQAQGAVGQPQPAQQPFPTLQPQPSQSPVPGIQPGTPLSPGQGGILPP